MFLVNIQREKWLSYHVVFYACKVHEVLFVCLMLNKCGKIEKNQIANLDNALESFPVINIDL